MTKQRSYRAFSSGSGWPHPICLMIVIALTTSLSAYAQPDILDQQVTLSRQTTTMYGLLNQVSRQTGYFFVYDSDLINNQQRVRIGSVTLSVRSLLNEVLDKPGLDFKVLDQHILIYMPALAAQEQEPPDTVAEQATSFLVKGRVLDHETGTPLPHANITIEGKGIGTISNMEGAFQFRLNETYRQYAMKISYMGYKSQTFPLELVDGKHIEVMMEADYISMQEVIIRYYDPEVIINEMLAARFDNYSNKPVFHTSFYREGVTRNNKLLNYSEAIFRIYKADYSNVYDTDQAVLVKSRQISNADHTDTLILKIKGGVRSALELDIMKSLPSFLDPEFMHEVTFSSVDIVSRDGRSLYAIEFEQTNLAFLPVYKGIFFIDMEHLALVSAEFEVHPKHIDKSTHIFIARLDRRHTLQFDRIHYSIHYQYINGRYHLSHVRGDLEMRFRPRNRLFSTRYHAFLEKVVGHIDHSDVSRFSRRETFRTHTTFIDQDLEYDYEFWGDYNIIPPEKQVTEAFLQIRSKIESIGPEE